MKIEEKIEKYLKEGKMKKVPKKDAIEKIIKVIKSAKTEDQLKVAVKMVNNFASVYRPIGSDAMLEYGIEPSYGVMKKLYTLANNQKLKIEHIKKIQKEMK